LSKRERELKDLKDQFREDFPVGPLIGKCCTVDQVQFDSNVVNILTKNNFLVSYVET
jgi:N-acetyltransferase 10